MGEAEKLRDSFDSRCDAAEGRTNAHCSSESLKLVVCESYRT